MFVFPASSAFQNGSAFRFCVTVCGLVHLGDAVQVSERLATGMAIDMWTNSWSCVNERSECIDISCSVLLRPFASVPLPM